MDDLTVLYPEPKKIVISGKEFILKPLMLKQSMALLKLVGEVLFKMAKAFPTMDVKNIDPQKVITPFIEVAGDRMKDIYAIILKEDAAWIEENMDIKSGIIVLSAFLEMNDIPFLVAEVKKMTKGYKEINPASAK